jgi:hypothetical protein
MLDRVDSPILLLLTSSFLFHCLPGRILRSRGCACISDHIPITHSEITNTTAGHLQARMSSNSEVIEWRLIIQSALISESLLISPSCRYVFESRVGLMARTSQLSSDISSAPVAFRISNWSQVYTPKDRFTKHNFARK